jgi:F-type H+-transporting ATPase subunit gamma
MPSAKDLKKKIRTISNTKKITRTMEMVATVKSKMATDRVKATTPYAEKLAEVLGSLAGAGSVEHPLFDTPAAREQRAAARRGRPEKILLFAVTGNRGFAGGYNGNIIRLAEHWLAAEKQAGREPEIHIAGKKGIARFRFMKTAIAKGYTQFGDLATFAQAEELAGEFMRKFLAGEVDRVLVLSTRWLSASSQKPAETQLLPLKAAAEDGSQPAGAGKTPAAREPAHAARNIDFIFEPDRETILKVLLPLSVKATLYRLLSEAAASEHTARRIAMKLATDNAEEIIKVYTRRYNRQRQAGITQQITEIVGGAEALA